MRSERRYGLNVVLSKTTDENRGIADTREVTVRKS